jgi:nucleotide-binding universal stress UspA family protein
MEAGLPVIVGVDGSESAKGAARWAGAIAERFDLPLRVVHGMPKLGPNPTEATALFRVASIEYHAANAARFLNEAADLVRAEHPGMTVLTTTTSKPIDDALVDASAQARFVVLGGTDISPTAAVLLGSTTLTLTTRAKCPVVAWRGPLTSPTSDAVVVGVDDSPSGRAALTTAFDLAERLGVPLHAVHSWSSLRPPGNETIALGIDWEALEAMQSSAFNDLVDEFGRDYRNVEVSCFLDADRPGRALLDRLEGAQLVVVGNRGRPALTAAVLGSTSLNMLHHAAVPVVVCHAGPDDT